MSSSLPFSSVTTAGGLLPADILLRVATDPTLNGCKPADYGIPGKRRTVEEEAERHWDYLKGLWADLRDELGEDSNDPKGYTRTDWIEPLFEALGFGRLQAPSGGGITSDDGEGTFQVTYLHGPVPIHLGPWDKEIDKRNGSDFAPHSVLQETLNRTEACLWGVVTNGRRLRILRDSTAIAGASYIEFDLEAIFDGELVSDFILLYRLLHVSRFMPRPEDAAPSTCWLESWRTTAISDGIRAVKHLRDSVKTALEELGTGFLQHPHNQAFRASMEATRTKSLHNALLRLGYRLLFLFVAEDRDALHAADADPEAVERYRRYFSTARLRTYARTRRGDTYHDLWEQLRLVFDALGTETGQPRLALPGLGGLFDRDETDAVLGGLKLDNAHLLRAIRALAVIDDKSSGQRRVVDYKHLGAEELGSVYESLLELKPQHNPGDHSYQLIDVVGNDRKTSGSYYTPANLIEKLLDTTLDPVLDDAEKRGHQAAAANNQIDSATAVERALLDITVCDPACGSGHFLVASARRIAKRLAAVREGTPEPTPAALQTALRDVIGHSVYGVDLNPMAVELAKVALWMESLEPGKALGFLDSHIKVGNTLLGTYPALMAQGIPKDAFKPITGDDKDYAKVLNARHNKEVKNSGTMAQEQMYGFSAISDIISNRSLAIGYDRIQRLDDNNVAQVRAQKAAYEELLGSSDYQDAKALADVWTAAFFWPKSAENVQGSEPTDGIYRDLQKFGFVNETNQETRRVASGIARENRFFHWHLEFPHVFRVEEDSTKNDMATGWSGGFSAVVGNPPWERIKLQEKEFFAGRNEKIASASTAAIRKKKIAELAEHEETRPLFEEWEAALRRSEGSNRFTHTSGRFPLTGVGDVNTYSIFTETDRTVTSTSGRTGVIVPTGIATDDTTKAFFRDLVEQSSLAVLYDFENRNKVFEGVDSRMKFCILSMAGRSVATDAVRFAFFLLDPSDIDDADRTFELAPDEILLLNPNTGTCPVFRSRRDAEITLDIYRQVPILVKEGDPSGNPWRVSFMRMFDMSNDSDLFHTREELERDGWTLHGNVFTKGKDRMLPLYEAKMLHHFDHRWATYVSDDETRDVTTEEKQDPNFTALPRYWVGERFSIEKTVRGKKEVKVEGVKPRLESQNWEKGWMLGWRRIARSTDERTFISGFIPSSAIPDSTFLMLSSEIDFKYVPAIMNSFVNDFVARQKLGGTNVNFFTTEQISILPPSHIQPHTEFLASRLVELSYTGTELKSVGREFNSDGEPFIWNDDRRKIIRCELDALMFHLYGRSRDEVDYIMETFPIVREKDIKSHGSYRTKELVLKYYDRMAEAGIGPDNPIQDGVNFTSDLTPPPGHGPRHGDGPQTTS
ncbi:Eco57I restriction-modification methylase domain-containing protein [Salininema proteolyticum]|uniref:site-specific DNA-methyltransferase (adenine-specific) n=1 Tax=Salininema proteolyticum TaxID=1607685 RepID=A0ABV8U3N8_9ACTN